MEKEKEKVKEKEKKSVLYTEPKGQLSRIIYIAWLCYQILSCDGYSNGKQCLQVCYGHTSLFQSKDRSPKQNLKICRKKKKNLPISGEKISICYVLSSHRYYERQYSLYVFFLRADFGSKIELNFYQRM